MDPCPASQRLRLRIPPSPTSPLCHSGCILLQQPQVLIITVGLRPHLHSLLWRDMLYQSYPTADISNKEED